MAFQMIAIMLLFLFLGKFLDQKFNFDHILTAICTILGVFFAIAFFMIQLLKDK